MRTRIIPVIHYADEAQTMRNAERAFATGADGVLLIDMEGPGHHLPATGQAIKARWPTLPVGINLLGADVESALAISQAAGLDMTWTDEQLTHSGSAPWEEAECVRDMLARTPGHLLFAGVAFKHQRHEPAPAAAALRAIELGFVPTTSGIATGVAAESDAVAALRTAIGSEAPLAIASGITPANAHLFAPHLSHILVATGVSSSFHEFDEDRLAALRAACDQRQPKPPAGDQAAVRTISS